MKNVRLIIIALLMALIQLPAQATTIPINQLALWSGSSINGGIGVTIDGIAASAGGISINNGANLKSLYTQGRVWLGDNAVVNGTVLANGQADAGNGLKLNGNWTASGAYLGWNSNINGDIRARTGDISLNGSDVITGNVLGNGNIWIGGNSTVNGDVRPGVNHSLSKGSNVTITGSTSPGVFDFDTFTMPQLEPMQKTIAGSQYIYGAPSTAATLLPGSYSAWNFGSGTTVNLSAGQYSLGNFYIDRNGIVNVDTSGGDVILNLTGGLNASNNVSFVKTGQGNLRINVFDSGVWLGDNTSLSAFLTIYNGNFNSGSSIQLTGSLYATGGIWLGNNSQVNYISSQNIPEPATIGILSLGVLGLIGRKK